MLERKLADPSFRRSSEIAGLLDDSFQEFGSSGRVFDKQAILEAIRNEPPFRATLEDFRIRPLSAEVVLVTYRARVERNDPPKIGDSLRSSLWMMVDGTWRIVFHQGTPTTTR